MSNANYNFTIKELPRDERPREKLIKYGAEQLSNSELLALIIRTGSKNRTAIQLARNILGTAGGLSSLDDLSIDEMKNLKGVGRAKGTQIRAFVELSKRFLAAEGPAKININNPRDVANLIMPELRFAPQEIFKSVLLDVKNQVIAVRDISRGSLTSSPAHPREVFREAVRKSSAAVILAHNHPSGIPEPSEEDIQLTVKIFEAGELLGIELLDHIVIGDGNFISMKEQDLF